MASSGRIGRIRTWMARTAERFRRPESMVMQAKRMISTVTAEHLLAISTQPALAYVAHPSTTAHLDLDSANILFRSAQPGSAPFNRRQLLLSNATMSLTSAKKVLEGRINDAKQRKLQVMENTRRSWIAEWKRVLDEQISLIKASSLPKDEKVSAIRELLEDLKHYKCLTQQEIEQILKVENEELIKY